VADVEKLTGRLTIIIPLVHLVACGLYMAGYSAGFGGNIGGMFSPSDFFTITIQHLITTYVLSLGMPMALILLRHRSGYTSAAELISQENDPEKKSRLITTQQWVVKVATWILPAMAAIAGLVLALQFWTAGARDYYFTFSFVLLALLPTWWNLANRLNFEGLHVEFAWCALAFGIGVVGLAMNQGDRDRRFPYSALTDTRMHCGNHVILSPIGDRFISVTPDNRRQLITDECKVQFVFQPTPIVPLEPVFDLIKSKLTPHPPSEVPQ
jgi:hypothetical protein